MILAYLIATESRTNNLDTTATVTMEAMAAGWRMTHFTSMVASVPTARQCEFVDAALRAKANCPISQLVNANVSLRAKLINKK